LETPRLPPIPANGSPELNLRKEKSSNKRAIERVGGFENLAKRCLGAFFVAEMAGGNSKWDWRRGSESLNHFLSG